MQTAPTPATADQLTKTAKRFRGRAAAILALILESADADDSEVAAAARIAAFNHGFAVALETVAVN